MKISKISLFIFALLSIQNYSYAQTYRVAIREKGSKKWGYTDLKGRTVIATNYLYAYPFNKNGVALTKYGNHYSFIDTSGRKIKTEIEDFSIEIPPMYGKINTFQSGVLKIYSTKWGALSDNGKISVPAKYKKLTDFYSNHAIAKNGKQIIIVHKNGKEKIIQNENIRNIKHFSEGLAPYTDKNGLIGFIDTTGAIIIKGKYKTTGYFSNGIAWARNTKGIIGYIDNKGNWKIEPKYDAVKDHDDPISGLILARKDDKWYYTDLNGNEFQFDNTERTYKFSDGLAIGRIKDNLGFLNTKGEWEIEAKFLGARPFKNGYAAASIDGDIWGIIDKQGNWVCEPKFSDIRDVEIINTK